MNIGKEVKLKIIAEEDAIENPREVFDEVLLCSVATIKKDSILDENVDENMVRVVSLFIQDTIIEKVIGSCLFDKLRWLITNDAICERKYQCYRDLLDIYLKPIFIWGVPADTSIHIQYKQRNQGVIKAQDEYMQSSQLSELKYINQYYQNNMDFYITKAQKYLCCNYKCFKELCCGCKCGCCSTMYGSKQPSSLSINLVKTGRRSYW